MPPTLPYIIKSSCLLACILCTLKSIGQNTDRSGLYVQQMNMVSVVPDTIIRIAISTGAENIEQYQYGEQVLYYMPLTKMQRLQKAKKEMVYSENYFDSTGSIVAVFKRASQPMFMRAQHWEPATFMPTKLIRLGIVWKASDHLQQPNK